MSRSVVQNKSLLLDIFSLPPDKPEDQPKQPEKKKAKKGKETGDDPDPQEPKKKCFRVKKSDGGFTVTRGDAGTLPPARLDIRCAYDTRGKNPLNVYRKSIEAKSPDFQIGKDGVSVIAQSGVKIVEMKNNGLSIEVMNQDFHFSMYNR